MLIECHKEFGNQWTKMEKYLPGRPQIDIKNHWHSLERSLSRKSKMPDHIEKVTETEKVAKLTKNVSNMKMKRAMLNGDEGTSTGGAVVDNAGDNNIDYGAMVDEMQRELDHSMELDMDLRAFIYDDA